MNSSEQMGDMQIARLAMAICATAETLGQTISAPAAELMAEDLSDYPASMVGEALKACRRELTGKLTLATILQRIQAADGRPGRDEAWGIAMSLSDESDSVVTTDEISLALLAARPILDAGDKIGARMAFISAYERIIHEARCEARPVKWDLSLGFDPKRRAVAVEKAVKMQRITQERAQLYLADLSIAPVKADGLALAGLISGNIYKPTEKNRERVDQLRADMKKFKKATADEKLKIKIAAANDLAGRRRALMEQSGLEAEIEVVAEIESEDQLLARLNGKREKGVSV
jgi:hypothetical protein